MKNIIPVFIFLVSFSLLSAQTTSRGVSAAGKIVKTKNISTESKIDMLFAADEKPALYCEISFTDPSEDGMLGEGETGTIIVTVHNNDPINDIKPKLLVTMKASWKEEPIISNKFLEPINPGQTGTFKSHMKWSDKYPAGTITYEVMASDIKTGLKAESVATNISLLGKGSRMAEPVFVDIDQTIPMVNTSKPNAIAVVIGNQIYTRPGVYDVEFAIKDARSMKTYLINMLGYREENIIYVENAQKVDFESIFGTNVDYQGKLYNYVKPKESDVFVYYSGHGAPDVSSKKAYILPSNAEPDYVKLQGYALDIFYKNLEKIPAKSVTVVIDACFSGTSQKGMLIKNASPLYINVNASVPHQKINVLSSAGGGQLSTWYPKGHHSLFTYFFLRGLRGEADKNSDRQITLREVYRYVSNNVPYMARRLNAREQTPVFKGASQTVICTLK